MNGSKLVTLLLAAFLLLLFAAAAEACPTCKDQMAADPAAYNMARGYFWSILFMLSMPFLILTGLGSYFYWEIRRAYANEAREQSLAREENPLVSTQQ